MARSSQETIFLLLSFFFFLLKFFFVRVEGRYCVHDLAGRGKNLSAEKGPSARESELQIVHF